MLSAFEIAFKDIGRMLPSRELFEHSIGINIRPFRRLFRIEGNFIAADFKIIFIPAVVVAENKAVVLFFVSAGRAVAHAAPVHGITAVRGRQDDFDIIFLTVVLVLADVSYNIGTDRLGREKSLIF